MIQADDRLKAIFDDAIKIARSNKHEYITLEHLLMIMIAQPEIEEMCKNHKKMNLDNLKLDLTNHIKEKMNDIIEIIWDEENIYYEEEEKSKLADNFGYYLMANQIRLL